MPMSKAVTSLGMSLEATVQHLARGRPSGPTTGAPAAVTHSSQPPGVASAAARSTLVLVVAAPPCGDR